MKSYIKLLGAICITYIITTIVITFLGDWQNYEDYVLDDYISTEIIRADGKVEYYDSNKFSMLNRGDRLRATINIPQNLYMENPTLCFHVYNCVISLSFEGEEFFRYGDEPAEEGEHIGTVYEEVIFPKEAIGKSLVLECVANENRAMNQLTDVAVMEAEKSAKAPIVNNLFAMMMFITIFVAFCMALVILSFIRGKDKIIRVGIWISWFSILLSIYVLSSQGLLNVLINNPRATANLEYISLFALPIPFGAYFYEMYDKPVLKKLLGAIDVFYVLIFVVCTVLNYTTTNYHYCRFLTPLHVSMVLGILVYVSLSFMRVDGKKIPEWAAIIRNGVVVLLIIALTDVVRFNLNQHSDSVLFKVTLLPMGMLIMIFSLLSGVMMQMMNRYREREEKRQLERLAYIDILTGLSNRAKCYEYVDEMKKNNSREYAVIFIDLNDLKVTNDKYGHQLGDQYIKAVATAMQKCFKDADVVSRFGGDEFVVLYDRNCEENIDELLQGFRDELALLNQENTFPFRIAAACGAVVSTKEEPLDVEQAVNMADKVMYEDKKRQKQLS